MILREDTVEAESVDDHGGALPHGPGDHHVRRRALAAWTVGSRGLVAGAGHDSESVPTRRAEVRWKRTAAMPVLMSSWKWFS